MRRINVARSGPRASFPSARTAPAPSHHLPFTSFHVCRGAEASLFLVPLYLEITQSLSWLSPSSPPFTIDNSTMAKVQTIVFLSLVLDLFAFTIPLPLFPRIIEWYTKVCN